MATAQITTSVSVLSSGLKGFQAVSLSGIGTASAPSVMAGSCWEQAGAFFLVSSDETPSASSWTAVTTAYSAWILATPAGSAGSQTCTLSYTVDAPIWVDSKVSWYSSAGSNIRALAHVYKSATNSYVRKGLLLAPSHGGYLAVGDSRAPASTIHIADIGGAGLHFDSGTPSIFSFLTPATTGRLDLLTETAVTALSIMGSNATIIMGYGIDTGGVTLKTKIIEIGEWNMDDVNVKVIAHGLSDHTAIRSIQVLIRDDFGTQAIYDLYIGDGGEVAGYTHHASVYTSLYRMGAPAFFDSTDFNATVSTVANRGWVTITYAV